MERRLAAILAADVEGYSRHTELDEEASTATLRMYRAVVEEAISAHRGRIFSSAGDGVVAEFPSIVEAIRCAVEIQNEIAERNASVPDDQQMQFRIGVNLGDVICEDNNLYGTGVNVAVRLQQLAEPGGICISQTVYDQVRKIVEIPFQDIGERRLKNIADPVHVYRILPSPLPWLRRLFSRTRRGARFGAGAGVLLLLLAAGAASFYLRQPAALWDLVLGDGGALSSHPAIAVLPFDDLSAKQDQEYLADGITEDLTTGLAKFPEFAVMARKSTEKYKGPTNNFQQIGKELNVSYLVDGSLARLDQNVRVSAQLIDATTGRAIWADQYDRQVDNYFTIRDEITRAVAAQLGGLQGKVAIAEFERLSAKNPNSFTAYDHLANGMYWLYKAVDGNQKANTDARELFEKARQEDPNYARVYAGLAWTYAFDCDFEWIDKKDYDKTVKTAFEMATTAVRLDPNDYQAYWALGWAYLYTRDPDKEFREHDKALANYKRARALNPNDAELLAEMSNLLVYIGRPHEAIDQLEDAIRLNPNHENWYVQYLGWAYEHADMPEKAIEILEPSVQRPATADELWISPTLAAAFAEAGRMDDARMLVNEIKAVNPEFSIAEVASRAPYKTKELKDRYVNALRHAGLPE